MASSNDKVGGMLVMLRPPRVLLLAVVALSLISLCYVNLLPTLTTHHFGINQSSVPTQQTFTSTDSLHIRNSTLGVSKVFSIGRHILTTCPSSREFSFSTSLSATTSSMPSLSPPPFTHSPFSVLMGCTASMFQIRPCLHSTRYQTRERRGTTS